MIQQLLQDMADNAAPKEVYYKFCSCLDEKLHHNHQRRLFLNGFLNQYKASIPDKKSWNILRLQYAETIEKATNDLKALRGEHGSYINGQDSDNIKKGAIRLVVESVKKQKICNYALERYIELHVKGRDISKIYQQIHEENNEVPERSFYNWVEKYENTLKALGYAQEN